VFELLAAVVDLVHALAMLVWGLGLPLMFWHRWLGLSRAYLIYSLGFISASVASQLAYGECFLTSIARFFAEHSSNMALRERTSFTVRLVEAVAGMRPSERTAVRLWELAIFLTCVGMLFYVTRHRTGRSGPASSSSSAHESKYGMSLAPGAPGD
jgi:hypothetical protein